MPGNNCTAGFGRSAEKLNKYSASSSAPAVATYVEASSGSAHTRPMHSCNCSSRSSGSRRAQLVHKRRIVARHPTRRRRRWICTRLALFSRRCNRLLAGSARQGDSPDSPDRPTGRQLRQLRQCMTVTTRSASCQKGPDRPDSDFRQCSDRAPTVLRQLRQLRQHRWPGLCS